VLFILNITYLDTQINSKNKITKLNIFILLIFGFKFIIINFMYFNNIFHNIFLINIFINHLNLSSHIIFSTVDMNLFSYFLYTKHSFLLILGGFLLFIAIIGSILLVSESSVKNKI
jgi:hypothetical protein